LKPSVAKPRAAVQAPGLKPSAPAKPVQNPSPAPGLKKPVQGPGKTGNQGTSQSGPSGGSH
jgi:hypothetical protein